MTDLVRPTPGSGDIEYGEWIGHIALALIPSHIAEIHTPASR